MPRKRYSTPKEYRTLKEVQYPERGTEPRKRCSTPNEILYSKRGTAPRNRYSTPKEVQYTYLKTCHPSKAKNSHLLNRGENSDDRPDKVEERGQGGQLAGVPIKIIGANLREKRQKTERREKK